MAYTVIAASLVLLQRSAACGAHATCSDDSSAGWLKRAAAENYEYGMDMRQLKDAMAQGGAVSAESTGERQGDGYTWSQESSDGDH